MPVTSPPSRDNHFNLLRLVLALLVLLDHAAEPCDGVHRRELPTLVYGAIGELAVDAFFLFTGYLIVLRRPLPGSISSGSMPSGSLSSGYTLMSRTP